MTAKELSQLYWLNREIERDKEKLVELECAATRTTSQYNQLPGSSSSSDRSASLAVLIYEQKRLIENKTERAYIEQNRLYRFIGEIDDSLMRQIMQLRYVNGLTWQQIAFAIGETDEQYPRRKHNAFLQNLTKMTKDI